MTRRPRIAAEATTFYRALAKIKVRLAPDISSPSLADSDSIKLRTGEWMGAVGQGEVFEVSEERAGPAGQTFLKLAKQEGWVFTKGIAGRWSGQDIALQVRDGLEKDAQAESFVQSVERQTFKTSTDYGIFYITMALLIYGIINTFIMTVN